MTSSPASVTAFGYSLPVPSLLDMVAWLSLTGTITGFVPISPVIALLLPVGLGLMMLQRKFPAMSLWALGLMTAAAVSAALYYPQSFLSPDFYRRDGNMFISFAPLIAIPLLRTNWGFSRLFKWWVTFAACVNAICIALFLKGVSIFADRIDGTYSFLFEAHNAAGGFLGLVTLGAAVLAWRERSIFFAVLAVVSFYGLHVSDSRGSMLALFAAIPLTLMKRPRITVALIVASQLFMVAAIWKKVDFVNIDANKLNDSAVGMLNSTAERSSTLEDRLFRLYPIAMNLWLESPIVGTGFGSFNDRPYVLNGIPHVFSANTSAAVVFNASHAHHSFLHVLAEQGLVGFILLMGMLVAVYRVADSVPDETMRLFLTVTFWYMILCSLTEHRFVTPSQAIPWFTLVALAYADMRTRCLREVAVEEEEPDVLPA